MVAALAEIYKSNLVPKSPKNWDNEKITVFCPKNGTVWLYNALMYLKDADKIANCVDPDQTVPVKHRHLTHG